MDYSRRLPIGADVQRKGGSHFRVWAPRRRSVAVVLEGEGSRPFDRTKTAASENALHLQPEGGGYWSTFVPSAIAGTLYRFRLDGREELLPDPASRFQPQGVHGPSQVIDPTRFKWTDSAWPGVARAGQVIYEMHIGTFTPEGAWAAAERALRELAGVGITVLGVVP